MSTNCIFFMDRGIRGIAALGKEIFVIHYSQSQVSGYDSDTLKASRNIDIPDMTSPFGLAGCFYNKALYISDQGLNSIHRVVLTNNSVTRWKVTEFHEPRGLSMTAEHTLLVTISHLCTQDSEENLSGISHSSVVEYTSEGEQVREIRFDESIEQAWQTVQLSRDQFIVCHGWKFSLHRACLLNTEGQIIKSYGGEKGGGLSLLNHPYSMTIDDSSKHVLVADHGNNRILLLDTDLNFLGQVHTPPEFRWPSHLYFDSLAGRLLVDSKESLMSSRCTARIIEHNGPIRRAVTVVKGVTVVNDEIYVLHHGQSHVDVYELHSLTKSFDIVITDMMSPVGLAGSFYSRALYISDQELRCIHRVDLTNDFVTRWKTKEIHEPLDLSVTEEHTLLVTFLIRDTGGECGVVEYTTEGQLVREILFDKCIRNAWQTVQLLNDQYIVCHGFDLSSQLGVSIITTEGQITKSYSGDRGTGEGPLTGPVSLATDAISKRVFVADRNNNRVLMFDADLKYLGKVHTPYRFNRPYHLFFHSSSARLFVGEYSGRLLVISPPD